ncbi:jg19176 [Pararge aegeria aegeria]|uniref:Jg19176 protein n=1 Tax=Pararge aegeria aegeria TaxID=348720 RepID=A0A8S4SFD7_9NEOP|nr:jg19176 [Pararge aegeria aegeria]
MKSTNHKKDAFHQGPKSICSNSPARRNKLKDLQRQLNLLSSIELNTVTSSGLPLREVLKNEVDDIVASECVFCGEHMIACIDKPFIADEDWDRVMKEWE